MVNQEKIAVAMSGGMDSTMAVHLLLLQGFKPLGITMKVTGGESVPPHLAEAAAAAARLGIAHHVFDLTDVFDDLVVKPFVAAYRHGLTPSPCAICNRQIKFGLLLELAAELGCERLATGHYVRTVIAADGRTQLRRGVDQAKDQSYFLFDLRQEQLRRACFPLGNMTKQVVREYGQQLGLVREDKRESQDLCFIPDGDYAALIAARHPELCKPGAIIEVISGKVLGRHQGYFYYTIGQRRGLGLGGGPWYVVKVCPDNNTVIVGSREQLTGSRVQVENVNWIAPPPGEDEELTATVQLRYAMKPIAARIRVGPQGRAELQLAAPVAGITPGQAAVFYSDDIVLGGGWIVDGG